MCQKLTDYDEFNAWLTKQNNGHLSKRQTDFLFQAWVTNTKDKNPFCCEDFPQLTRNNFRQYIRKNKVLIEIVISSRPCFYKLRGIELPGGKKITDGVMGDCGEKFAVLLQTLREQPASIHDIKIKINFPLHEKLRERDYKTNPKNNGIFMKIPNYDQNIIAKASVYPETIQLDLGCSITPIIYNLSGIIHLTFFLGKIWTYFFTISGCGLPDVLEWIITHYHFGKDGKESKSGQTCHFTYEEVSSGLIRFYNKLLKNGSFRSRIEQIQTPHSTLDEEMEKIMQANSVSR